MVNWNPLAPQPLVDDRSDPLTAQAPTAADAYAYHAQALQSWMAEQRRDGVARGLINPDTGWPTQNALLDAARQYGGAMLASTTSPGLRWYHGTGSAFDRFNTPEAYITTAEDQALAYAHGAHRLGQAQGAPMALAVTPKPGKVQNIDDHLFDAMDDGLDVGDAVEGAIAQARKDGGVRYLEYTHPNAGSDGEHTVRVSLYPNEDIRFGHD